MKTPDIQNKACPCGAAFVPTDYTPGYAVTAAGMRICYACADAAQREELRDRSKPFVGYLTFKQGEAWQGFQITTWTGGKLMTVTTARPCRLTRRSWVHGETIQSIHAVDVHGGHWTGRGNAGIAIKLRPVNS